MTRKSRPRGETAGKKYHHRSPALQGGILTDNSLETLVLALIAERATQLTATEILEALQLVPRQLPELRKTLMRLTERASSPKRGGASPWRPRRNGCAPPWTSPPRGSASP